MRPIPESLKKEILADPYYEKCARADEGDCQGRITWEHAIIYKGQQVNALWAIIPICAFHHDVDQFQDGGNLDKEKHEWIALNRATDEDILDMTCELIISSYSKAIYYTRRLSYLNTIYGKAST